VAEELSEHTVVIRVSDGELLENRFRIDTKVGQGAMGSVFRGRDEKLGRSVAIKILAPEHCRKPKILARFEREAAKMTTLRHPNLVQFLSHGRRGALPYIVMEFLEGLTLTEALAKKGNSFSLPQTLTILQQLVAGLSFLHSHNLIHRDVKPQNVILSPSGKVTILDLGVVRDQAEPGLTRPGAMVGTPFYMSPEQILGASDIDVRTDVYALAAVTFELLVGHPPYLGNNNFEVLYGHKHLPPPDASVLKKSVSREVAYVLQLGLAKDRKSRVATVDEFLSLMLDAAQMKVNAQVSFEDVFPPLKRSKIPDDVPLVGNETIEEIRSRNTPVHTTPLSHPVSPFQTTGAGQPNPSMSELKTVMMRLSDSEMAKVLMQASQKRVGHLRVLVTSGGQMASAMLWVDGKKHGPTPATLTISEGPHLLRVELAGFRSLDKPIVVNQNSTSTLTLVMEKQR
jgi:serine/threonine protein kinase